MNSTNEIECPHLNTDVIYSVAGKKIYRDQCLKCYDDAVKKYYIIYIIFKKIEK